VKVGGKKKCCLPAVCGPPKRLCLPSSSRKCSSPCVNINECAGGSEEQLEEKKEEEKDGEKDKNDEKRTSVPYSQMNKSDLGDLYGKPADGAPAAGGGGFFAKICPCCAGKPKPPPSMKEK
jgi:hypothetical protein